MLLKLDTDLSVESVINLLKGNGIEDVKPTCWQTEMIECEVEYRRENDSQGYPNEVIKKAENEFREILDEDLDDTAIDNEYLGGKWQELLDKYAG